MGGEVTNLNSYVDETLSDKEILFQEPKRMVNKDDDIMWLSKNKIEIEIKNKQQ